MHTYATPADLVAAFADWLVEHIRETLLRQPRFTLALSGGNTPKALYERLATEPYRDAIDWHRLHIFWGDERFVPFDDEQNNAGVAFRTLLGKVPVVGAQVHLMRTTGEPEAEARRYDGLLHTYFDNHAYTFDLVLLGMGADGHTLSLFPGTPVVGEDTAWAAAFFLESQAMHRLTLTAPVVNRAAQDVFLVTGADKAEALKAVREGVYQPETYPAQRIQPSPGQLRWFVDEAAARLLDQARNTDL